MTQGLCATPTPPNDKLPLLSQQESVFGTGDGLTGAGAVASPAHFGAGEGLTAPATISQKQSAPASGRERNLGQEFLNSFKKRSRGSSGGKGGAKNSNKYKI